MMFNITCMVKREGKYEIMFGNSYYHLGREKKETSMVCIITVLWRHVNLAEKRYMQHVPCIIIVLWSFLYCHLASTTQHN